MLRKITGLLILISFLLIKSTPLFAADQYVQKVSVCCTEQQHTDEDQDTEKETKQLEITDEAFIDGTDVKELISSFSEKLWPAIVPGIFSIYMALPYPPPNPDL